MSNGRNEDGQIKINNFAQLLITAVLFTFAAVFVLDRSNDNWKKIDIKTYKTSTHTIADFFVTR